MNGDEVFFERQRRFAPVNGAAGRGVDEPLDAGHLRVLEQLQCTRAVDQQVALWVVDGVLVGEQRRQVKNNLRFFKKHPLQLDFVEDVAFDEKDVGQRGDVPDAGRGKVVQNDYFGRAQSGDGAGEV